MTNESDNRAFSDSAIREVAAQILGVAASSLTDESSPETIDQWDSLNHLQLITAIEQRFDLTLPMAAVMEIQDMGSLSRIVQSHL
jgi:acyl carrier protein